MKKEKMKKEKMKIIENYVCAINEIVYTLTKATDKEIAKDEYNLALIGRRELLTHIENHLNSLFETLETFNWTELEHK
jgi:hypothetical protein